MRRSYPHEGPSFLERTYPKCCAPLEPPRPGRERTGENPTLCLALWLESIQHELHSGAVEFAHQDTACGSAQSNGVGITATGDPGCEDSEFAPRIIH